MSQVSAINGVKKFSEELSSISRIAIEALYCSGHQELSEQLNKHIMQLQSAIRQLKTESDEAKKESE